MNPPINMDVETRLTNLTELVEQLSLTLNNAGLLNNPRPNPGFNDRFLNVDVPNIEGTPKNSLERYFDFKETPEDQRYKLAKVILKIIWLEEV